MHGQQMPAAPAQVALAYFGEGKEDITDRYVRLAFCKREEEIAEAVRRIEEKIAEI